MFEFEEAYKCFWEQPDKHALVKHNNPPIDTHAILKLEPRLFTLIAEDYEDAKKLAKKMIEHGVKVFDNYEDFFEWYNNRNQ
jgi:hypothetical protein